MRTWNKVYENQIRTDDINFRLKKIEQGGHALGTQNLNRNFLNYMDQTG
jgi:hypothetical protein